MEVPDQYLTRVLRTLDRPGMQIEAGIRTAYAVLDAGEGGITTPELRAIAYVGKAAAAHCTDVFQKLDHLTTQPRNRTLAYYPTGTMERFCQAFNQLYFDLIHNQLYTEDRSTLKARILSSLAESYGLPHVDASAEEICGVSDILIGDPPFEVQEASVMTRKHPLSVVHQALGGFAAIRGIDMGVREVLLETIREVSPVGQQRYPSLPAPRRVGV